MTTGTRSLPVAPVDLAAELRAARQRLGLTQAQVGAAAGIGAASVSMYENGGRLPSRPVARCLAVALELDDAIATLLLAAGGVRVGRVAD